MSELDSEKSILSISVTIVSALDVCDEVKNRTRLQISNWVDNSRSEPRATERNRVNSFIESRPCPSAIFEGIETTALRICSDKA